MNDHNNNINTSAVEEEGFNSGGRRTVSKTNVTFTDTIGHGWFGWVVSGNLKRYGKIIIKILKEESSPEYIDKFRREHESWETVKHENVVKIVGSCFNSFPMLSLMEWSDHICAKTYLKTLRDNPDLDLSLQLSMDLCSGLAALHHLNVVVPDLAARNCVLNEYYVLKIGDYGLGRAMFPEDYWPIMTESVPLRWSSPDQLNLMQHRSIPSYNPCSMEDNLWGLGVVIWELLTCCQRPYQSLSDKSVLQLLLSRSDVSQYFTSEQKTGIKYKCVSLLACNNLSLHASQRYLNNSNCGNDKLIRFSAVKMEEELSIIARTGRQHMETLYRQLEANLNQNIYTSFTEVDITEFGK